MNSLDSSSKYYNDMINEMNQAKSSANTQIPGELGQVASMYGPGGSYGAGALDRIKQSERSGVAGTMGGLVSSGMSSGSLAAGVRSKYGREAATQMKEVEDTRTDRYATALNAMASARAQRGINITNAYQTTASLIKGWKSPLEEIAATGANQIKLAQTQGNYGLQQQQMNNSAAMSRQVAEQTWQSNENALYKTPYGANKQTQEVSS
jgi:hypothetical protein